MQDGSRFTYQTPFPQQNFLQRHIVRAQTNVYPKYNSKVGKVAGILEIFLGSFILLAAVTAYVTFIKATINHMLYELNTPLDWGYSIFWAPVLTICAGSFGVLSARTKARGPIVATMIFSILSHAGSLMVGMVQGMRFFILLGLRTWYDMQYTLNDYVIFTCYGIFMVFGCIEACVSAVVMGAALKGLWGGKDTFRPRVVQRGMILSPYAPPQYDGPYTTQNVENGNPNACSNMDDEKKLPLDEKNF